MAPEAEQPQPNMFANWGADPVGNWKKVMDKKGTPAEQFVTQQMQQMNIPDPNEPQPVVPYAPPAKVTPASSPTPADKKQKGVKVTDSPTLPSSTPTGGTGDASAGMDYLASLYTSPEQEEKLRKASIANQRIMAVTDALRHIGNIYGAVHGAVPMKFNNPVAEEELRYQKGKAMRDAANYKYMTYQQAKAQQEAKQKQWEADYALKMADAARKAGYTEAQIKAMQDRIANQKAYQEGQLQLGQRKADDQKAYNEARLKQTDRHNRAMEGAAYMNAKTNRDRATAYINKLNKGGNASTMPLQTPKGAIYAPGKSIPQAQMNQMYRYAVDHNLIANSDFQKKMAEAGFGKADPDYVRNQLVAEAMMEHSELADFARDNYGWSYDGGGEAPSIGWDDEDNEDNGLSIGW